MAFTITNTIATPFQHLNYPRKVRPDASRIITRRLDCVYSDSQVNRRNVLIGLGSLFGIAASTKAANAGYAANDDLQPVDEFGSQPRVLDKVILCLVDVPEKKDVVIVAIDDIDIPNNDAVRFDVYIAKPVGKLVGQDYGEYIGSEVDLPRERKNIKGVHELGITYSLEEMGAEDSDKSVVTLVPRTGKVTIGGIRIYTEMGS